MRYPFFSQKVDFFRGSLEITPTYPLIQKTGLSLLSPFHLAIDWENYQSLGKSINQLINKSINQSVNRSVN